MTATRIAPGNGPLLLAALALFLIAAWGCVGCASPEGPPPTCHEFATVWCDLRSDCPGYQDTCHAGAHVLCAAAQGTPLVSRACVDALASVIVCSEFPIPEECKTE